MSTLLLTTKLYIPPPRPSQVSRQRLKQRLDEGLRQGHRLTLVSAPAGFGKMVLVTDWICDITREVAWLSLDEYAALAGLTGFDRRNVGNLSGLCCPHTFE